MAFNKYLNSKRVGYITIILLFSSMFIIIPMLAVTFGQVMKFSNLTNLLIRQKREKIAVSESINKSIEYLSTSDIYHSLSGVMSVNPGSSSELLVHEEDSEAVGEYMITTEIYNMNYVISEDVDISDDTVISDILNFPPSQITVAEEKHFLIKTIIHKNDAPSYCKETAVEIRPSENIIELWHKEYVIY